MTLDGLLLVGGKSRRMGTDKAQLIVEGEPLWQRGYRLLQTSGCGQRFVAAPQLPGWLPDTTDWVEDPGEGPLRAIISTLQVSNADHLLVLAVDLPAMSRVVLDKLVAQRRPGKSLIPQRGRWFEGLAALYSSNIRSRAESCAHSEDRSMQHLVRQLLGADLADLYHIPEEEHEAFTNWNTPDK